MTNEEEKRWYALKVFFNRAARIEEELRDAGHETYMPVTYQVIGQDEEGYPRYRKMPLASLLFLHVAPAEVRQLRLEYYGRFLFYGAANAEGRWVPSPVSDKEMETFRSVTAVADPHLEYLSYNPELFASGKKVRITAGPFAGAEGVIKRIRHDRRFLIEIKGICLVATSYIPQSMVEPV